MIQTFVRALARSTRTIALAAVAIGLSATALAAQGSTGKIEGYVLDQNEQPVPNANVLIVGTAYSATANAQGYYFINSVPSGEYSIRASFIGYKRFEVTGFRIISGQTVTLDFPLEATTVELTAITVVAAENALVPRDQVTSKQLIDGAYTSKLPVDNFGGVLALQPGVMANSSGSSISVRGSRPDENNIYVDGVSIQPGNRSGVSSLDVAPNTFEDGSVTTGASSAEFGNAQGGVIAITTKTGGQRFAGSLAMETDEFSGANMSSGYNRLDASLSGPVFGDLTFFVGGVVDGSRFGNYGYKGWERPGWTEIGVDTTYAIPKTNGSATSDTLFLPVFKYAQTRGECDKFYNAGSTNPDIANNYGHDCLGNRGGGDSPSSSIQLTSKLNYSFGQGSRIALTYLTSRGQSRNGRGNDNTSGTTNTSQVLTLNWNQVLTKNSSNSLALDAYVSYQTNFHLSTSLTPESEASTREPFMGWEFGSYKYQFNPEDFPVNDELLQAYRAQDPNARITVYDYLNPNQYTSQNGYGGTIGANPGSVGSFGGTAASFGFRHENRLIGKANIDWQLDRYNRVKFGGEYTKSDMDEYGIPTSSLGFSDLWIAEPTNANFFIEDRLDLGDVVLVGGLRYDYFDVGSEKWSGFPRLSSHPDYDPLDPEGSIAALLEPYTSHDYISPHIQVAFPVTDRTNFRLSYAQQVQAPNYSVILQGSNTDLQITNTNNNYGTDLDFGKTVLFEFGVRHAFSDDMVLDVTVYNKDNLANAAGRLIPAIDPRNGESADLRLSTNQDFGNTRGIDVRIDRRIGRFFNGVLSYTYQDARNTGSDPYTYINFGSRITSEVTGGPTAPAQAAQPVGYSRPHSLAAQMSFNFPADFSEGSFIGSIMKNVGIYGIARYTSGTPYTPCATLNNDGDLGVTSGSPCNTLAGDFNGTRLPAFKNLDLRITKGFRIGSVDLTAYADGRNILNLENITAVFAQTGTTANARYAQNLWTSDSAGFAQLAQANGIYDASTSAMQLPGSDAECGAWVTTGQSPSPPTCYFYRKEEQRFGNGDGLYTLAEQRAASDVRRLSTFGINRFAGAARRIRFGMEVNF